MVKKQKKNKKWWQWVVFLVLFVVAAMVVYFVCSAVFNDKKSDDTQKGGQSEAINNSEVSAQEIEEVVEKPKTVQYDGDDPNILEELSGVVTHAGVSGNYLMIRVNIDQYLQDGTCELVLTRNNNVLYNDAVRTVDNVTTSTCEGFDVPVGSIGEGEVEIVINLNADGKSGVITGEASV